MLDTFSSAYAETGRLAMLRDEYLKPSTQTMEAYRCLTPHNRRGKNVYVI